MRESIFMVQPFKLGSREWRHSQAPLGKVDLVFARFVVVAANADLDGILRNQGAASEKCCIKLKT